MSKVRFEVAELQLVAIFECTTLLATIQYMREVFQIMLKEPNKDPQMIQLMVSAMYKLSCIREKEYQNLHVGTYLIGQEDDAHEA